MSDYPVQVKVVHPASSSRLWALLTILWIKFIALIPHIIVLILLTIALEVVFWVAQVIVLFTGRYPRGVHKFMTGVVRWQTRVSAFVYNLTDEYPPFTLDPAPEYPVNVEIEYRDRSSRLFAAATLVVGLLWIFLLIKLSGSSDSTSSSGGGSYQFLNLRQIVLLPHLIVLAIIGIAGFFVWLIVQWVILVGGSFPDGLHNFLAGLLRWGTKVTAFGYGLTEKYPPFSFGEPTEGMGAPESGQAAPYPAPPAEPQPPFGSTSPTS